MLMGPIIYKKWGSGGWEWSNRCIFTLTCVFSKMAPGRDVRGTSRDYGNMSTWVHVDITVKNEKTQKKFRGVWG